MGLWSGLAKANMFEKGRYMKPDFSGIVEVRRTLVNEGRKHDAFIVEFLIVTTNMEEEHPVGEKFTWYQKLTDKDTAFSAIKQWCAAMSGIHAHEKARIKDDLEPIIEEIMDEATENETDNMFIGLQVKLVTVQTTTRDGGPFTRYDWIPSS